MKKHLSMLIAVVMVLSMFPAMIFSSSAEDYAAMIGETGYVTLSAAMSAATKGDTVVLCKDVTPESEGVATLEIAPETDITLDMNGHNITTSEAYDAIWVRSGLTFTVINTLDVPSQIYATGYDANGNEVGYSGVYLNGNLTVAGDVTISGRDRGITVMDPGCNVVLKNGAKIVGRSEYGINTYWDGSSIDLTIENASVSGKKGGIYINKPDSSVAIYGSQNDLGSIYFAVKGTLTLGADAKNTKYSFSGTLEANTVTNSDGSKTLTFDAPPKIDEETDKPEAILNGVEYDTFAEAYELAQENDTIYLVAKTVALPCLTKSGITIEGVAKDGKYPEVSIAYNNKTQSIVASDLTVKNVIFGLNGGYIYPSSSCNNITFENCEFRYRIAANGTNYTFKNCLFNGENGIYYATVTGYMILDGCTFETELYGFHNTPGDGVGSKTCVLTVKDCGIATWCAIDKANTTTFEGCYFYESGHCSHYYAVNMYDDAVVNDCTFEEGYFLNLAGTDKIIELNNCEFTNGNTLENVTSEFGNSTFIVDGVKDENGQYIGGTLVGDEERTSDIIADGYVRNENGEIVSACQPEAELNGVKYETFAEAYALAQSGDTIYLIAETVELPFLDKNGITIEGVPQDGKNPEIKIAEKNKEGMVFTNANDLTIKNVIFGVDDSVITTYYKCDNINFEGCEFRCKVQARGSNFTFKDCVFNGYEGLYYSVVTGEMLLEGCTFNTVRYGFHNSPEDGAGKTCTLTVKDCDIATFCVTSAANDVTFDGCTFYENGICNHYYCVNLYGDAVVNNCTFENGYFLGTAGADSVIEINNCEYINGATVENVTSDVGNNVFVIDGEKDENGKYISGTVVGKAEKTAAVIAEGFEADEEGVIVKAPLPEPRVNFTNISFTVGSTMSANVSIEDGIYGDAYTADKCVLYIDVLVDGEWIEIGSDTVVPATDAILGESTATMKFSVSGIPMAYLADNMRIRLYAYGDETFYAEVTELDEGVDLSFVNYTEKLKKMPEYAENASLISLLNTMLNYTASVQQYKGHNTDNLANAGLSEEEKAVTSILDIDFSEYSGALKRGVSSNASATVTFDASQLLMSSDKTGFQFYFTVADDVDVSALEVQVKYNGKLAKIPASAFKSRGNGQYSAIFEGLDPTEFDVQLTVAVFENGNKVSNVAYDSIPATAKLVSENPRYASMVDIFSGMLAYCKAAKAYIAESNPYGDATPVATVEDLKAALSEGTQNVVLTEDMEISEIISITRDITLDLNGKTLTNDVCAGRVFFVTEPNVTLTIDGTKEGSGICASSDADGETYGIVDMRVGSAGSKLVVNGGTYTANTNNGALFKIRDDNVAVELNNVTATTNRWIFDAYNVGTTLTVNGGHFTSTETVNGKSFSAFYFSSIPVDYDKPNISFTDTTIVSAGGACIDLNCGIGEFNNCDFTVTNPSNPAWTASAMSVSNGSWAFINGGTYTSEGYGAYVYTSGGNIIIDGGAVITGKAQALVSSAASYYYEDGHITLNDGTINGDIYVYNDGDRPADITINGGSVNGSFSTGSSKVATIHINGGTFTNDPTAYVDTTISSVTDNGNGTWTVQ